MRDDISILIQGPISEISLSAIEDYVKFTKNIIISTWNLDDNQLNNIKNRFGEICNLKIINEPQPNYIQMLNNNELFGVTHGTTWYWQILGIYNGIIHCDTEYIIRTRSDEYFKNLNPLIDKFFNNGKKFTCGNIWFKPKKFMPLHIGDHIYIANTNILKNSITFILNVMLGKLNDNINFKKIVYQVGSKDGGHNHPESILAKSIILHTNYKNYELFDYDTIDWADDLLCKNMFDVIDINELKPIRWFWGRVGSGGDVFDENSTSDESMAFIKTIDEY